MIDIVKQYKLAAKTTTILNRLQVFDKIAQADRCFVQYVRFCSNDIAYFERNGLFVIIDSTNSFWATDIPPYEFNTNGYTISRLSRETLKLVDKGLVVHNHPGVLEMMDDLMTDIHRSIHLTRVASKFYDTYNTQYNKHHSMLIDKKISEIINAKW